MAAASTDLNRIPGADALGYGFNAVGRYDTTSLTQRIFEHQNERERTWTFPPTEAEYWVPDNTAIFPTTETSGSASVSSTQQEFQQNIAASAGISGSYAGFSGEFDFAYSSALQNTASYYYAYYEAYYQGWQLGVQDQGPGWVSSEFEAALNALPDTFGPDTREAFFRFYRRWGTHYVNKVSLGGSLTYFLAVSKSFSSSETKIDANVKLEYKAVFVSAKAEAKLQWEELTKSWAENRTVKVHATGGSTSVLDALQPGYGDADADVAKAWQSEVMLNPGLIGFRLTPLASIAGDRQGALEQALDAYLNGAILGWGTCEWQQQAWVTSGSIIVNGSPLVPKPPVTPPTRPQNWHAPRGGYRIGVLDAATLEPIMVHDYYQAFSEEPAEDLRIYDAIMADLDTLNAKGYYGVVAGFGLERMVHPPPAFLEWLHSIGAEAREWLADRYTLGNSWCSYVAIGRQGLLPGRALEAWSNTGWISNTQWSWDADAAAILLLYASTGVRSAGELATASLLDLEAAE